MNPTLNLKYAKPSYVKITDEEWNKLTLEQQEDTALNFKLYESMKRKPDDPEPKGD